MIKFDPNKNSRTIIVLKNFFDQNALTQKFEFLDRSVSRTDMLTMNSGLVRPALWRNNPKIREYLCADELACELQRLIGVPLVATDHSDYHVNTLGGWHDDTGAHLGGYIPDEAVYPSLIFKVAVFNSSTLIEGKQTQFQIDGHYYCPDLSPGDVLCFPIEVKHRGYPGTALVRIAKKLKNRLGGRFGLAHIERQLRGDENRKAYFFTVGAPGPNLDFFIAASKKREDAQLGSQHA